MKPSSTGMSIMMTLLVIVFALALEIGLYGPLFQLLFLQTDGIPFGAGVAMLVLPKAVVYGLTGYLGARFLGRFGRGILAWVYVAVIGTCWVVLRWGHNWPGPGWAGMLFTYGPLLVVPIGLVVGAALAQRVERRTYGDPSR